MRFKMKKIIKALLKSLSKPKNTNGSVLEVEPIDTAVFGLYKEKDPLISKDDYVPAETIIGSLGLGYWMKKSDKGIYWHSYDSKKLKLHKNKS